MSVIQFLVILGMLFLIGFGLALIHNTLIEIRDMLRRDK